MAKYNHILPFMCPYVRLNWCTVNENVELVYNKNTILNIKSPCLLKLTFRKNELINLEQID